MYLSELKLWNFRKYGSIVAFDRKKPNLTVPFKDGINVLIGENDTGKSAIVDAIRLVLGTHSLDWTRVTPDDFFTGADRFRIELRFDAISTAEGKNFTEWLDWVGVGAASVPCLSVFYEVARKDERILPSDVKAGADVDGHQLSAEAKDYLRVTYLKPLRDAKADLVPRRNSRLSQILQGHEAFKGKADTHHLVGLFSEFNKSVTAYFSGTDAAGSVLTSDQKGKEVKDAIETYLRTFTQANTSIDIGVVDNDELRTILETLGLSILGAKNPGLGTLNRMFMASELVHVNKVNWSGLRLALIEELEAHLHPQAQMKVVEGLQKTQGHQIILTTHSPNLASKVPLDSLIMLNGNQAFPMGKAPDGSSYTKLDDPDQEFLQWFLDVTKSNLFFAKGVLMVEGWAEEILLPALALKLKRDGLIPCDLTEAGVAVVNVGGTSQLRYAKIFCRASGPEIDVPVAVVTDVDVRVGELVESPVSAAGGGAASKPKSTYSQLPAAAVAADTAVKLAEIRQKYDCQRVKAFVAPQWTLEYCLFKSSSLSRSFQKAVKEAHPEFDATAFEKELGAKLIKRTLDKVEIAKILAQTLVHDAQLMGPSIPIDSSDASIAYLVEAIKYASRA
jgi:putative ATP-dependent endonuclease of OLD family